jgi:hypothetical protein
MAHRVRLLPPPLDRQLSAHTYVPSKKSRGSEPLGVGSGMWTACALSFKSIGTSTSPSAVSKVLRIAAVSQAVHGHTLCLDLPTGDPSVDHSLNGKKPRERRLCTATVGHCLSCVRPCLSLA